MARTPDSHHTRLETTILAVLREARDRAGYTNTQLADLVDIPRAGLTKILQGTRQASLVQLLRLCDALDLDLAYLLTHLPKHPTDAEAPTAFVLAHAKMAARRVTPRPPATAVERGAVAELRDQSRRLGVTQEELAAAIGISRNVLYGIYGGRPITLTEFLTLCVRLGLAPGQVLKAGAVSAAAEQSPAQPAQVDGAAWPVPSGLHGHMVIQAVLAHAERQHLTPAALSEKTGLALTRLLQLYQGAETATLAEYLTLCHHLNVDPAGPFADARAWIQSTWTHTIAPRTAYGT